MTKQDKTIPRLAIGFGGGFGTPFGGTTNRYPPDRLEKFLNVDPNNETDVINFCNSYRFVPRDIQYGVVAGFKKEHEELSEMAKKLATGTASEEDLAKLDKILNTSKIHSRYIIGKDLVGIKSKNIEGKYKDTYLKGKFLIQTKQQRGTIVSLWEDLADHIKSEQTIQICANCGDFFFLENKHKRKFCKPSCKNSYNKDKWRKLKRKSN